MPKVIVVPKNEKDVINTINIAKKFKSSVTVRGAGTGLVGSALNTGIILDMKNFNSLKIKQELFLPILHTGIEFWERSENSRQNLLRTFSPLGSLVI